LQLEKKSTDASMTAIYKRPQTLDNQLQPKPYIQLKYKLISMKTIKPLDGFFFYSFEKGIEFQ
jgi:hypothetical protein